MWQSVKVLQGNTHSRLALANPQGMQFIVSSASSIAVLDRLIGKLSISGCSAEPHITHHTTITNELSRSSNSTMWSFQ